MRVPQRIGKARRLIRHMERMRLSSEVSRVRMSLDRMIAGFHHVRKSARRINGAVAG